MRETAPYARKRSLPRQHTRCRSVSINFIHTVSLRGSGTDRTWGMGTFNGAVSLGASVPCAAIAVSTTMCQRVTQVAPDRFAVGVWDGTINRPLGSRSAAERWNHTTAKMRDPRGLGRFSRHGNPRGKVFAKPMMRSPPIERVCASPHATSPRQRQRCAGSNELLINAKHGSDKPLPQSMTSILFHSLFRRRLISIDGSLGNYPGADKCPHARDVLSSVIDTPS